MKYLGTLEQSNRRNNFTIIRMAAACGVLWGHAYYASPTLIEDPITTFFEGETWIGALCVRIFFVISGFLVLRSLMRGAPIWQFFVARLLRIYPALIVCNVATLLVIGGLLTVHPPIAYFTDPDTWMYVRGNLMFWLPDVDLPGVFEDHRMPETNASYWTLPAEVRLYLMLGLLGSVGLFRFAAGTRWALVRDNFVIIGLLVWVNTSIETFPLLNVFEPYGTLGSYFFIGMLIFLNRTWIPISAIILIPLSILWIASIGGAYFQYVSFIFLPYAVLFCAYGLPYSRANGYGDLSYGTYIYGFPIQQVLMEFFPGVAPHLHAFAAMLLVPCVAVLSWRYVEQPALQLKARLAGPSLGYAVRS